MIRTWCIPPEADAAFVADMETVLDVYAAPHDDRHPLICFDEASKELHRHLTPPVTTRHGTMVDTRYGRNGMVPLHVWLEPRTGRMGVRVTTHRTSVEFGEAMRELVAQHPDAEDLTVVLDNLNTHRLSSLYAAFPPPIAGDLRRRLRLVFTPKHGSWLNMAELAISILSRAVLKDQRFATQAALEQALTTWIAAHNATPTPIAWTFDVDTARTTMPRVYPIPYHDT